jgi:hypothetical protein
VARLRVATLVVLTRAGGPEQDKICCWSEEIALDLMPVSDIDKQPPTPDIINRYANVNPAEQTASGRKSDPGAELACQAHGDLAADAAAYLERSGHTLQSIGGDPQAIERQAAGLIDWARQRNLILANDYAAHLFKHNSSTAEHQVLGCNHDSRCTSRQFHQISRGRGPD